MTGPAKSWTYRAHAAGRSRDESLEIVRARALRHLPDATFVIVSERRTATGWSFEISRTRPDDPDPWQPLRDAGYTELELRAAAGDK